MATRQNRSAPLRPLNAAQRLGLWPLRVLWLVLPPVVGPGVVAAVAERTEPVRTLVELGLWSGWFLGLIAVLAPSTVSLTAVRILAPSAVASSLVAAATAGRWTAATLVALGGALLVTGLAFLPLVGDPMINGSAYGSERRMALRPPAALLLGPVQLAWLVVYAGAITGPLLLVTGRYLFGVPALVVGWGLAVRGARTLHQLSRRWLVFVPAGFVVHDFYTLAESLLIQRRLKPELSLAADADSAQGDQRVDLSGGAYGLALCVRVAEPLPFARRVARSIVSGTGLEFVFSPTLPGQALAEARVRAIKIN